MNFLKSWFGTTRHRVKIFEGMDTPMPNFNIVATHVRAGMAPQNYLLDDGEKLKSIVEKWRFKPGTSIGRCGYDYQILFTNGDTSITMDVCFLCKTLVFNHSQVFVLSKRKFLALLEEDFKLL
jgi:hypothetical protein